jgi:hypothetical protein
MWFLTAYLDIFSNLGLYIFLYDLDSCSNLYVLIRRDNTKSLRYRKSIRKNTVKPMIAVKQAIILEVA